MIDTYLELCFVLALSQSYKYYELHTLYWHYSAWGDQVISTSIVKCDADFTKCRFCYNRSIEKRNTMLYNSFEAE